MEFCQTSTTAELLFESGAPSDDWPNGGYVNGLFAGVVSWCWCKFFGKLVLFQGMCMEFRDKIMLQCSWEVKCHGDCSRLNPGARGKHLTSQLSWVGARLLVKRVCPINLVDELVFVSYAPVKLG